MVRRQSDMGGLPVWVCSLAFVMKKVKGPTLRFAIGGTTRPAPHDSMEMKAFALQSRQKPLLEKREKWRTRSLFRSTFGEKPALYSTLT
jgi:hypothetical protein